MIYFISLFENINRHNYCFVLAVTPASSFVLAVTPASSFVLAVTTSNIQHPASNIQHPTSNIQPLT